MLFGQFSWKDCVRFIRCLKNIKKANKDLENLLQALVVEFKSPELQACREATDGGQSQQELLCCTQRHVRIGQLCLLDPLLLFLSRHHGQDFLKKKTTTTHEGQKTKKSKK